MGIFRKNVLNSKTEGLSLAATTATGIEREREKTKA